MSKTDEMRNRFHVSLDAPIGIGQRSGETEEGTSLGEMLTEGTPDVLGGIIYEEEREERVRFLKQFFALLKQILTPEEFKFIKLRFTKKKTDKQIAVWLGFHSASGVFRSIREKLRGEERTLNRLVGKSEWEGAGAFVKAITENVIELSRDAEVMKSDSMRSCGFSAFMKAQELAWKREHVEERARVKRRFYMRGFYRGVQISPKIDDLSDRIRGRLYEILSYMNLMVDHVNNAKETRIGFYEHVRKDILEYLGLVQRLVTLMKDSFFEDFANYISDGILEEDFDEAETREAKAAG